MFVRTNRVEKRKFLRGGDAYLDNFKNAHNSKMAMAATDSMTVKRLASRGRVRFISKKVNYISSQHELVLLSAVIIGRYGV
jgi:hypothetical protein